MLRTLQLTGIRSVHPQGQEYTFLSVVIIIIVGVLYVVYFSLTLTISPLNSNSTVGGGTFDGSAE
ncbi:MAG: hypothetical protein WC306_04050 [Candidatus Paceibacterota bacterium]